MAAALSPETLVELVWIPPSDLGQVWNSIAHLIPSIIERSRGRITPQTLVESITASKTHLFVIWDGAEALSIVGLSVEIAPSGKTIGSIRFASGKDSPRWVHLMDDMEQRARDLGCEAIEVIARKGWERKLPAYKLTHVVLEKDLI